MCFWTNWTKSSALRLVAVVMEAAKEDDAVFVHGHPVPGARIWAAPCGQLLPCVCVQIQPPQVPVVFEFLLRTASNQG